MNNNKKNFPPKIDFFHEFGLNLKENPTRSQVISELLSKCVEKSNFIKKNTKLELRYHDNNFLNYFSDSLTYIAEIFLNGNENDRVKALDILFCLKNRRKNKEIEVR